MNLLNLSNVSKSYSTNVIFQNVSFLVEDRDKIGLVGVNGAGKTTLFRILTGQTDYDSGNVLKNKQTKIGYLEQYTCADSERCVMDELLTVFGYLQEMELKMEQVSADLERNEGDIDALIREQQQLHDEFARLDGFTYKSRARAALFGLGFSEEEFQLPVRALSGGQKTRVSLAKILLSDANLLLLDEPTNHLDISSCEWLEDFLKGYQGAVIVISHDRYFLDSVTGRTFEMENQKLTVYEGNYTTYFNLKAEYNKVLEREYTKKMKEIHRLEGVIEQQRQWSQEHNYKTAESKQKQIDRIANTLEKPEASPDRIRFHFHTRTGGGYEVLTIRDLSKSFDQVLLFESVNMDVRKGEHVFLLGPNGCGKTTLFKMILGQIEQSKGTVKIGQNIQTGYYDQTQSDIAPDKTVFDEVSDAYPKMTNTEIRNALAAFLFRGDDVFLENKNLSGGERARVSLIKLMLSEANFLLLDEPTNHLDIQSREALEEALSGYEGTMLVVSHDRYFINKMADKIYYLQKDGVQKFDGNYSYYLEKFRESEEQREPVKIENDYKKQKELESAKRRHQGKIKRAEEKIEALESEIEELTRRQAGAANDYEKLLELEGAIAEKKDELNQNYELWEALLEEQI